LDRPNDNNQYAKTSNQTYVRAALNKDKVDSIFKDILTQQDQQMPTDEIANMWVQFKFSKTKSTA
jgi:hypothetical protein